MQELRFVAEFTTNHMGNMNLLLRMAEKAAWAGCTYIKMQKKDIDTFYTKDKLNTPYESPYGKTYREYREIFEFSREDFQRFDWKCKELGVQWFATVQDIPSLFFLLDFDLPIYKIASSNIRNQELFDAVRENVPKDREIVVSTAGATLEEIDEVVEKLSAYKQLTILHCVAEYPCPQEACRLGNIKVLMDRYSSRGVKIGYSGHEEGFLPSLAAASLGIDMLERHFCISRRSFVHHIDCSLEPEEYKEMIEVIKSGRKEELMGLCRDFPKAAWLSHFGMSSIEREFLIEQKYGKKYIVEGSFMG